MKVLFFVIVVHLFVGHNYCQNNVDILNAEIAKLNDVQKKLDNIKTLLNNKPDFVNFANIYDSKYDHFGRNYILENVIKEECEKNGADADALESFILQKQDVEICVERQVDFAAIKEELQEASFDFIGEYCKKWSSIYKCFDHLISFIRSCMNYSGKQTLNQSLDLLTELQEFLCFNDGERIQTFVVKGGIQCIQERSQGVQSCLQLASTQNRDTSPALLPGLTSEECELLETQRRCINSELRKCRDTTPANVLDSALKFIEEKLSCKGGSLSNSWFLVSVFILAVSLINLNIL